MITGSQRFIFPLPRSSEAKAFIEFLKTRMEAGEFRAVIDREYPLEAIADAYRYVETEQKTGIVVVHVGPAGADAQGPLVRVCEWRKTGVDRVPVLPTRGRPAAFPPATHA